MKLRTVIRAALLFGLLIFAWYAISSFADGTPGAWILVLAAAAALSVVFVARSRVGAGR